MTRAVVLFKSESEEYRRVFSEREYRVIFVEPLRFEHTNEEALAAALARRQWAGLALCSARAVDALAARWVPALFAFWSSRRVYALGPATARRAKLQLGLDALGTAAGDAKHLAQIITDDNPPMSEFLFPCGNLSLEILPDILRTHGIVVETLTVYKTKENEGLRDDLIKLNEAEQPCGMVFFSPSGCEYIHRQLQTFSNGLYHLPHFAIGNSTAHKIENLGIEIAGIAAEPRPESIRDSVDNYFASQKQSSSGSDPT